MHVNPCSIRVSSQNVPKQNVPDADQSFLSIMGCGDKILIDVFIQFKSLLYIYA